MTVEKLDAGHPAPSEWQTTLPEGRVRCDLCPRYCTMKEGQRGFCFVRGVHEGRVVLTSYGRASGFCIDPIEKKPLDHFLPGTSVLSFGTAGCNLGCRFCQNHDISKARAMDTLADVATPEAIAKAAAEAGCRSVAYTYNDPVIFAEYAIDTAQACRERGVASVAVSAGYITEKARERFFGAMDAANIDLKGFTEDFYRKLAFAELAPVLDTLAWIHRETHVWLEVTTLLIPGHNDSEAEIARLVEWMAEHLGSEVPLHFTAFHPDFKMLDVPPTPASTLTRARAQALAAGLKHVYTGNVHDVEGQSTYCAACQTLLIERDGYVIRSYRLDAEGRCPSCLHPLAGRFEARPGTWGARRRRLFIEA
jgi:pyruvate formate lyase activating enzyme